MPVDGHELQAEGAHLELVAALDLHLPGLKMMLLALGINKPQSQLRADQRNIRTQPQQIRHPADMILMPMSQHQSIHPIQLILDIAEVRQNQIHARLLLLRKQHAAVNQQNMTVILDHIHIAANLTQTPQRDNTHGTLTILRRSHQTLLSLSTLTTLDGAIAASTGFIPGPAGSLALPGSAATVLGRGFAASASASALCTVFLPCFCHSHLCFHYLYPRLIRGRRLFACQERISPAAFMPFSAWISWSLPGPRLGSLIVVLSKTPATFRAALAMTAC